MHKFQCTFCTETFKTKHDWVRHEKSLHLSLEQWVCSPEGPSQVWADRGYSACVYCGLEEPPHEHADQHNYPSCAERSLVARTFYRKDHLRQHLNLFHDAKFQNWSMDIWRMAVPDIQSRCGICGLVLDSWEQRVQHLAEHFKSEKSMVDWTGDWGFAEEVLRNVENAMPPCAFSFTPIWLHSYQLTVALDLIHYERSSLNPYEASKEDTSYGITIEEHEIAGNPDLASHYHPTGLVDSAAVQYSAFESDGRQPIVEDWTRLPNAVEMATSDSSAQQQVSLNTHDTGSFYQEFPSKHNSLDVFSRRQLPLGTDNSPSGCDLNKGGISDFDSSTALRWSLIGNNSVGGFTPTADSHQSNILVDRQSCPVTRTQPAPGTNIIRPSRHFLTDANCYRRLEKELTRFVLSSLSPNNPLQHVCT